MARTVKGDNRRTEVQILTREDNRNIDADRLSIRVTSEIGQSAQMSLSQAQALELAAVLLDTVREQVDFT